MHKADHTAHIDEQEIITCRITQHYPEGDKESSKEFATVQEVCAWLRTPEDDYDDRQLRSPTYEFFQKDKNITPIFRGI